MTCAHGLLTSLTGRDYQCRSGVNCELCRIYISPGISPGAAAPLELLPEISTLSNVPAPAASGYSGLVVHEKIHLFMTNLLQMTFERVNRADFN